MRMLALLTITTMIFVTGSVFACGDSCDKNKDKDDQAFTVNVEYLCGGDKKKCEKPAEGEGRSCGGCKKKCEKPAPEPKPEEDA